MAYLTQERMGRDRETRIKISRLGVENCYHFRQSSFHKSKDVLAKIEAEMPNIRLEFLPPYSPDFNLIELVWHSAKEYIAHKLFESVNQLE